MAHTLCGLLLRFALVHVMLQRHWRLALCAPAHGAPAHGGCSQLPDAKRLTNLLESDVRELLEAYNQFHGTEACSTRDDVPDASVSGDTVAEKLRDVYAKNALLYLHILKVEEYQVEFGGDQTLVAESLGVVKGNLHNHLVKVKVILQNFYPDVPLPPTPAPLQLTAGNLYAKKEYGRCVIVTLGNWLDQVLQVLEETKSICHALRARVQMEREGGGVYFLIGIIPRYHKILPP